jgi:cytochrome P450
MQQRKPWNQAFSSAAVKKYEGMVANRIRQLLACLENLVHESDRKESSPLDMAAWLRYFR